MAFHKCAKRFFQFAVAINALLLFAFILRPDLELRLDPDRIFHEQGNAYGYPADSLNGFFYQLSGDNARGGGHQSILYLFEDGEPLGPAHAAHVEIRKEGRGRFSHWENFIFFSSSDNAPPTKNGRIYLARGTPWIRLSAWLSCVVALPLAGLLLVVCDRRNLRSASMETATGSSVSPPPGIRQSKIIDRLLFWIVVLITFGSYWTLLGGYFDRVYEPDTNFTLINQYQRAISGWDFSILPIPGAITYFDGASIIYALFAIAFDSLSGLGLKEALGLNSQESVDIFIVYFVNIVAYSLSAGVFLLTCQQITRAPAFAFLLALIFAFAPQILDINPLRIDYLISSLITIVGYLCIRLFNEPIEKAPLYFLGLAMALLMTTKLTGIVYLALPFFCLLICWYDKRATISDIGFFLVTLGAATVALMARFLVHGSLVEGFIDGIGIQQQWASLFPMLPYSYYNIENFREYGNTFLTMVLGFASVLLYFALRNQHRVAIFVLASLLLYSILLMVAPKHARWGHTISYFYFLVIAAGYGLIAKRIGRANQKHIYQQGLFALFCLMSLAPIQSFAKKYLFLREAAGHKMEALQDTKLAPMDWFKSHPEGRVCIFSDSDWMVPPLTDLGINVIYGPFKFPYTDSVAMSKFEPPTVSSITRQCDYIVVDKIHRDKYIFHFRQHGFMQLAKDWENLIDRDLRTSYDYVQFNARHPEWDNWNLEVFINKRLSAVPGASPLNPS